MDILSAGDVNTCDECWEMLNQQYNDDLSDMISDADPGYDDIGYTQVDEDLPGYLIE